MQSNTEKYNIPKNSFENFPIANQLAVHHQNLLINIEPILKGYNVEIMKYNNTTFYHSDCFADQNEIIKTLAHYEKQFFELIIKHFNIYYNYQPSEFIRLFLDKFKFNLTTSININYCLNHLIEFIRTNKHNEII